MLFVWNLSSDHTEQVFGQQHLTCSSCAVYSPAMLNDYFVQEYVEYCLVTRCVPHSSICFQTKAISNSPNLSSCATLLGILLCFDQLDFCHGACTLHAHPVKIHKNSYYVNCGLKKTHSIKTTIYMVGPSTLPTYIILNVPIEICLVFVCIPLLVFVLILAIHCHLNCYLAGFTSRPWSASSILLILYSFDLRSRDDDDAVKNLVMLYFFGNISTT